MPMTAIEIILIIFVIIFVIYHIPGRPSGKKSGKTPKPSKSFEQQPDVSLSTLADCYRRQNLLTKTEYIFYGVLKRKCDAANLLICPKVRMEDFIRVTAEERMKYRGYIKSRHVDFLICDSSLHILAAIELDDPSHLSAKAQKTDHFKNQLYKAIGLPLFRIQTGQNYSNIIDELILYLSEM